ncbi:tryptophan synthase subunit alpha [Vicingaceae bacterium]|nr:tryptophan synthase subunit alpha [Vicingaceae bacterium]
MSAIDELFLRLRSEGKRALMPFITAGDPDLEFTASLIKALDDAGCHLCEVGIPYSDPIADGPVIQASYTRALNSKIKLTQIFEAISGVADSISMPLVTMVSFAIIYRHGVESFVESARAAGFSGAIVPDLPTEESTLVAEVFERNDFSLIPLITPAIPEARATAIAEKATGFIYYVSVTGITGERNEIPDSVVANVQRLKQLTQLPICIGFGISKPNHVEMLAPVADGLIVGSAIVRRIGDAKPNRYDETINEIKEYVTGLLDCLN